MISIFLQILLNVIFIVSVFEIENKQILIKKTKPFGIAKERTSAHLLAIKMRLSGCRASIIFLSVKATRVRQ